MSKSHAVTSAILFHMFQQEMPNHEFVHQVFSFSSSKRSSMAENRRQRSCKFNVFLCYLIMRYLLSYIDLKSAQHSV